MPLFREKEPHHASPMRRPRGSLFPFLSQETTRSSVGRENGGDDLLLMSGQRGFDPARFGVPEFDLMIIAGGRERPAVRRERNPVDFVLVPDEGQTGRSGFEVPEPNGLVLAGGCERLAVRRKSREINFAPMSRSGCF